MTLRRLFTRKPVEDMTTTELLRRTFRRRIWLFIVFAVTYVVFAFLSSSYTLSYAIPLGIAVSPVLFYLNLYIFRRYIEIEALELTLNETIEPQSILQEDMIIRKAVPPRESPVQEEAVS